MHKRFRSSLLLSVLVACGACAVKDDEGSAAPSAEVPDPILEKRLANIPKAWPWPLDWFEPKERIAGADNPAPLPVRADPLLSDEAWAEAVALGQGNETSALFVWKDGALDRTYYAEGFDPGAWVNTYYLNYFVLVALYGTALDMGEVASLDDPVGDYIEEWEDTTEGAITLRNLLQMHAGLELYGDSSDPDNKATRMFFGGESTAAALEYRSEQPGGELFEYNYVVPEILGIALQRATGMRYADLVSQRIWSKIGGSDAAVWLDREGGRPHFNAALFADADDWLRFGVMIAQEGRFGGQQVVPENFIATMAKPSPTNPVFGMVWLADPFMAERRLSDEVNYTVKAENPFTIKDLLIFDGYGGQRIYVSPSQDLVIVRIGKVARAGWDDSALPNIVAAGLETD